MFSFDKYKYVIGLGNPGLNYATTPHNLGYIMIDRMLRKYTKCTPIKMHNQSLWRNEDRFFSKPNTYMNRSGEAIAELCKYFNIDKHDLVNHKFIHELLILHDDIELDMYEIRYKNGQIHSGLGGHNGLRSIVNAFMHLGVTKEYAASFDRIRIGCKQVNNTLSLANYVTCRMPEDVFAQYGIVIDNFILDKL